MMWDFGDQVYSPGQQQQQQQQQRPRSVNYPPPQSTYPPLAQDSGPYMPVSQPSSTVANYGSSYASPPPSQYGMPAANTYDVGVPRGPVNIDITYSSSTGHSSHHTHRSRRHSHSNGHHHRPSNARPPQVIIQQQVHHQRPAPRPQHQPVITQQLPMPEPRFQYSRCTGMKKALCIGVNYLGSAEQLNGCINDARNVQRFLVRHCGYEAQNIVVLTDDAENPRQIPTRQNMLDAMRWLVKDARTHDALFFHYSGHGSQVKDRDGDELDGYDEVILPVDFRQAGIITDDLMHEIMVTPLPIGCRLTALFDSCHSGTALDLPYLYHSDGRLKGSRIHPKHQRAKASSADVISFSGCKDSQTSADTYEDGAAAGAMSYAFISALKARPVQTYQELLQSVRKILKERYSQKPQLSSSHKIDTGLQFIL